MLEISDNEAFATPLKIPSERKRITYQKHTKGLIRNHAQTPALALPEMTQDHSR
jgi:hypothetical protein